MAALEEIFDAARGIMSWLGDCAKVCLCFKYVIGIIYKKDVLFFYGISSMKSTGYCFTKPTCAVDNSSWSSSCATLLQNKTAFCGYLIFCCCICTLLHCHWLLKKTRTWSMCQNYGQFCVKCCFWWIPFAQVPCMGKSFCNWNYKEKSCL